MKILNRAQIYQADKKTQEREAISGLQLMERAARALKEWMVHRITDKSTQIYIFSGPGNNGGDGLALARLLVKAGYSDVSVFVVGFAGTYTSEFDANLKALHLLGIHPKVLDNKTSRPNISPRGVVVDAIFGIGLNRSPAPWVLDLIDHLNASGAYLLAVDVPSGLFLDQFPGQDQAVIKANMVLSFGAAKLPFYLPQAAPYVHDFEVLDIGWDMSFLSELATDFEVIQQAFVKRLYRPRLRFSHKGTYGHVRVIGGSHGKIGAAMLSARASLFAGAGLVSAWIPSCGYVPFQTGLPEAMVQVCGGEEFIGDFPEYDPKYTSVVGMGIGLASETRSAFLSWLAAQHRPLVIDADGLTLLSEVPEAFSKLPKESILTPHPGELVRMIGPWEDDYHKLQLARDFSNRYSCVLLIKGAYTMIFSQGKGYINTTGNPGMATAGSGDVLAGVIGGLLAQGYPPLSAAQLGVYLHGRAGDVSAYKNSQEAVTASGILENLGKAFMELYPEIG